MEKINFINNQAPAINATNLNKLQDNVENAIRGVVESGSNANGSWVKYDDGRMECWGTGVFPNGGTYENDSYVTVNFPQTFVGDKNVFEYIPKYMSGVDSNIILFTILVGSKRYGAGDITVENDVVYRRLSNSTNQTPLYSVATKFDWKAKGYWK